MVILGCIELLCDSDSHRQGIVYNAHPVHLLRLHEHDSLDKLGQEMKRYCEDCQYFRYVHESYWDACDAPHVTWYSRTDTETRFAYEVNANNNCREYKKLKGGK